jgi:hypothetical protein
MAFLRRDLFSVQLDDGITIAAVLPEGLFSIYDPNVPLNRVNRPSVDVEMREPPALPKVVAVSRSSFCGARLLMAASKHPPQQSGHATDSPSSFGAAPA